MTEDHDQGSRFTSTLSAAEFALTIDAGFTPAGYVMGSSVCHIGFIPPVRVPANAVPSWPVPPGTPPEVTRELALAEARAGELTKLSEAIRIAKDAATERLTQDAARLGADGVVGVRLTAGRAAWLGTAVEVVVTGTAVRRTRGDASAFGTDDGRPFLSDLSGQDFWTLLRSGHRPVGIVLGWGAYRPWPDYTVVNGRLYRGTAVPGLSAAAQFRYLRYANRELPKLTEAVYAARELAMGHMRADAARLAATGIVGVRIFQAGGHDRQVAEFGAVGTAIAPLPGAPPAEPPVSVLPLTQGK